MIEIEKSTINQLVNKNTKVPKYFIFAWVIGDIYVAQKFSLTFEKWLCLCYRSFCCCCGKIVKASFVFDLARTKKKWKKQRHRGVGGSPRDRSVVKLLQNKNFAFFHIVLQYFSDFSVLRKTHTFDFPPPQMSSKNNIWNLQSWGCPHNSVFQSLSYNQISVKLSKRGLKNSDKRGKKKTYKTKVTKTRKIT